jgi:hypothetical protein
MLTNWDGRTYLSEDNENARRCMRVSALPSAARSALSKGFMVACLMLAQRMTSLQREK